MVYRKKVRIRLWNWLMKRIFVSWFLLLGCWWTIKHGSGFKVELSQLQRGASSIWRTGQIVKYCLLGKQTMRTTGMLTTLYSGNDMSQITTKNRYIRRVEEEKPLLIQAVQSQLYSLVDRRNERNSMKAVDKRAVRCRDYCVINTRG